MTGDITKTESWCEKKENSIRNQMAIKHITFAIPKMYTKCNSLRPYGFFFFLHELEGQVLMTRAYKRDQTLDLPLKRKNACD